MQDIYAYMHACTGLESQSIVCDIGSLATADIRCDNANNSARGAMAKCIAQSCRQRRQDFIRYK